MGGYLHDMTAKTGVKMWHSLASISAWPTTIRPINVLFFEIMISSIDYMLTFCTFWQRMTKQNVFSQLHCLSHTSCETVKQSMCMLLSSWIVKNLIPPIINTLLPTWIWPNSGKQWKTGGPGMLWCMGSQRVGHTTKQQQQQFLIVGSYSKMGSMLSS